MRRPAPRGRSSSAPRAHCERAASGVRATTHTEAGSIDWRALRLRVVSPQGGGVGPRPISKRDLAVGAPERAIGDRAASAVPRLHRRDPDPGGRPACAMLAANGGPRGEEVGGVIGYRPRSRVRVGVTATHTPGEAAVEMFGIEGLLAGQILSYDPRQPPPTCRPAAPEPQDAGAGPFGRTPRPEPLAEGGFI
jgi:hypothetical protein